LVVLTAGADSLGATPAFGSVLPPLILTPPPSTSLPTGQVAVTDLALAESLTLVSVT
jgi:hypothetical protein